MEDLDNLQNILNGLYAQDDANKSLKAEMLYKYTKVINELFNKTFHEYLVNDIAFEIVLDTSQIAVYLKSSIGKRILTSIRFNNNFCSLNHHITNDDLSINSTKIIIEIIQSINTQGDFYKAMKSAVDEYKNIVSSFNESSKMLRIYQESFNKKLYLELRQQIVSGLNIGDKYQHHLGLIEIINVEDKTLTFKILEDKKGLTGLVKSDSKFNFAHQILEKAPSRTKKIAESLIDATVFKK
jgi:hypothetical protein